MSETLKPETSLSFSVIEVCVFGFWQEKKRKTSRDGFPNRGPSGSDPKSLGLGVQLWRS